MKLKLLLNTKPILVSDERVVAGMMGLPSVDMEDFKREIGILAMEYNPVKKLDNEIVRQAYVDGFVKYLSLFPVTVEVEIKDNVARVVELL